MTTTNVEQLQTENAHLRRQVTELQARGTALLARSRPCEARFVRVRPNTPPPAKGSPGASCVDLWCMAWRRMGASEWRTDAAVVDFGEAVQIATGLAVEVPEGYECQVRPRSSAAVRMGLHVPFGTIDSDYRGEILTMAWCLAAEPGKVAIEMGTRVAQLAVVPLANATWLEVHGGALTPTERGAGGFGSTGR